MTRMVYLIAIAMLAACGADPDGLVENASGRAADTRDGANPPRSDHGADPAGAAARGADGPAVALPNTPFVAIEPAVELPTGGAGSATAPSVRVAYSHIRVTIDGDIARTVATEVMANDLDSPVEASFSFPLPDDAAVTGFAEWRDGVRVQATVEGKQAARTEFERAAASGERAALAEQEPGRTFTISLAPIPGRGSRRVELSYTQTLTALGGERAYALPARRFVTRAPTQLDVDIDVSATRPITSIVSLNHPDARVVRVSEQRAAVHLSRTRAGLGHDLVVRWNQPAEDIELSAHAARVAAGEPGYVEARLAFNRDPWAGERPPLAVALVVDASLSMAGEPLARAQELAGTILDMLDENDRVALVSFAGEVRAAALARASAEHRTAIERELAGLVARGHSNLAAALDEAAEALREQPNPVLVLMTDGQPTVGAGVDDDLPAASAADFAGARVVIAHFNYPTRAEVLDRLFPHATRRYVPDGEAGDGAVEALARLAVAPEIEDLAIEVAGAQQGSIHGAAPGALRRLAMGESARLLARADGDVTITVHGALRGRPIALEQRVSMPAQVIADSGLPVEWARLRIHALEARYAAEPAPALADEIRALGKTYGLATRFTSFVSTDRLAPDRIKPGDPEIRVRAPRSATAVFAVLPWGEVAPATWREDEALWLARFLVPRGTPDGLYRVRVFVTSQAGTALRSTLAYRVDSAPPQFSLEARYASSVLTLTARPVAHVFDRTDGGDELRLSHVDLKQVTVRVAGREIALAHTGELEWTAEVAMPLTAGCHSLVLIARDWAANTSRTDATVDVPPGGGADAAATPAPVATTAVTPARPAAHLGDPDLPADPFAAPDADASWLAHAPTRAITCVLPGSPVLATATLPGGGTVAITPGALRLPGRVITRCDGLPGAHPTSVAAWRGDVVVGFRDAGVHLWDGRGFTRLPAPEDEPGKATTGRVDDMAHAPVRALAAAGDRLYIGTAAGLWRVDAGGASTPAGFGAQRVDHHVLGTRAITALHVDAGGALHAGVDPRGWWVVTPAGGARARGRELVGCFAEARGQVRPRPPGPDCWPGARGADGSAPLAGLPSAHVTALAAHDGALYVGLFDRGLWRLDGDAFRPVAGVPAFVNAILSAPGVLYVATPVGLYAIEDGRGREVVLGLPSAHVNGLALAGDGTLWLATGGGLVGWRTGRADGAVRVIDERAGLPSRIVYAVTQAADGAIWAGTAAGAVRLSENGATLYSQSSGALPHDWITALLPDGDGVLAGTYDAGVARLRPGGTGELVDGTQAAWVNPGGLIRLGDQVLAATLGNGLIGVRATGHAHAAASHGERGDGAARAGEAWTVSPLPSDDVTAAALLDGTVWVGTRAGLARILRR